MKKIAALYLTAFAVALTVETVQAQTTLADWTFGSVSGNSAPGAGVASINFYAGAGLQAGTAAVIGLHAGAALYSPEPGDDSPESLGSTVWAKNDYYQFSVSTLDYQDITISYDQISTPTGPGIFRLEYSTDGSTFTDIGNAYSVLVDATSDNWNDTNRVSGAFSDDLSSLTALNNDSTLYFRLVDSSTESASQVDGVGGDAPADTAGSDRIDNIIVDATATPEPSTLALAALGGLGGFSRLRRRR